MLSPYETDPLDLNPLRQAIAAHVDVVGAPRPPRSPAVRDRDPRADRPAAGVRRRRDLDRRAARLGLPAAAVPRGRGRRGEPYWDGGYVGNPTPRPLVRHGRARDLVLVELAPDRRDARRRAATPRSASGRPRSSSTRAWSPRCRRSRHCASSRRPTRPRAGPGRRSTPYRFHRIGPPPAEVLERPDASLDRSWEWDLRAARRGSRRDATIPAPRRTEAGTHVDARHRAGLRHRTQAADPPPGGRYPRSPTVKERG